MFQKDQMMLEALTFFNNYFGLTTDALKLEDVPFFEKYSMHLDCLLWKSLDPKYDAIRDLFYRISPYDFFRCIAKGYDKYNVQEFDQVFESLRTRGLKKLMDFGGGTGMLSLRSAEEGFDTTYSEVNDLYVAWMRHITSRLNLNVKIVDLGSETLTGTYDAIVAKCVIEHVPTDKQRAMIARLQKLTPNGIMIIMPDRVEGPDELRPMHYHLDLKEMGITCLHK